MRIYLLRHGHAEPRSAATSDANRALTDEGVERLYTAARVLKRLNVRPAHIYSSPRVRAKQTADIISEILGIPVEVDEGVDFHFGLDAVERLTAGLDRDAEVMFVGHEPSMSEVVYDLTGADAAMKKGGLARIDMEPGSTSGELIWLIAPKVFDTLGATS